MIIEAFKYLRFFFLSGILHVFWVETPKFGSYS